MHRRLVLMALLALAPRCGAGSPTAAQEKDKMMLVFQDFKKTYDRTYKDQEEENRRFEIFVENMEEARLRQEAEEGTARYGVTKFSDLPADEVTLGNSKAFAQNECTISNFKGHLKPLPVEKDWRDAHVTPVKNQQKGNMACKSCWAFSVVANVESQWSIRNNMLISLSEQELLDCGNKSNTCEGGSIHLAFEDVKKFGLERESDYPYVGKVSTCRVLEEKVVARIQRCVRLPENETMMEQYVAFQGTISVLVALSPLLGYKSGIMATCSSTDKAMHAMLVVGYGIEGPTPYWTLKNSWGTDWGEKGYIRILRGKNVCEINKFAMSAVV